MRLFLKKLLIIFLIIFIIDFIAGSLLEHYFSKTSEGDFGDRINLVLKSKADVFIFGCSRAEHHYIPEIISRKTGMTVFNAGFDGKSILFHYSLLILLLEKHKPGLIVLDLNENDVMDDEGKGLERISLLLPYSGNPEIRNLLLKRSRLEWLKMILKTYKFNSMILSIIKYNIFPNIEGSKLRGGYTPLKGVMKQINTNKNKDNGKKNFSMEKTDSLKLNVLNRFIRKVNENNITLILCQSPAWNYRGNSRSQKGKRIIREKLVKHGAVYIPVTRMTDKEFNDMALYRDNAHLNHNGAKIFSEIFADKLNKKIKIERVKWSN